MLKGAIVAYNDASSKEQKTQRSNNEKYQVVCYTAKKGWKDDPQACHFHVYAHPMQSAAGEDRWRISNSCLQHTCQCISARVGALNVMRMIVTIMIMAMMMMMTTVVSRINTTVVVCRYCVRCYWCSGCTKCDADDCEDNDNGNDDDNDDKITSTMITKETNDSC
jgi:hypothetical protein